MYFAYPPVEGQFASTNMFVLAKDGSSIADFRGDVMSTRFKVTVDSITLLKPATCGLHQLLPEISHPQRQCLA